mmetsp:Transcript_28306/g.76455  ORF Transcript_28306/g.76455 Transcript_28306/m.76455 type:complete len:94 (+) Transcript_28306:127-408(+)
MCYGLCTEPPCSPQQRLQYEREKRLAVETIVQPGSCSKDSLQLVSKEDSLHIIICSLPGSALLMPGLCNCFCRLSMLSSTGGGLPQPHSQQHA